MCSFVFRRNSSENNPDSREFPAMSYFCSFEKVSIIIQHELLQGLWSRVTICLFIKIKNFISWIVNLLKLFTLKMYVDISKCIVCQLWSQLWCPVFYHECFTSFFYFSSSIKFDFHACYHYCLNQLYIICIIIALKSTSDFWMITLFSSSHKNLPWLTGLKIRNFPKEFFSLF